MHQKVSVIVPTYNRCGFLERTLGSIFAQTVPVHEVLLVDDGSTDGTAGFVEALHAKHPDWIGRLRYFRQDNRGKSAALNSALRFVTGDWVAFNDSDDCWLPHKLEIQFKALNQYAAGCCFSDARYVNNPNYQKTAFEERGLGYSATYGLENDVSHRFSESGWAGIFMQTLLVHSQIVGKLGDFDASIRMSMDADFVFRLGLAAPMCFVNLPLVEIDRTAGRPIGLTTQYPTGSLERLHVHEYLLGKWLSLTRESRADLRRGLLNQRSSVQSAMANRHLLQGEFGTARSVLGRAMRQNPRVRIVVKFLWSAVAPEVLRKEISRREARRGTRDQPVPRWLAKLRSLAQTR
jgi:glycosyltransferase involved in cell wall biosynthesis